ncbi:putative benzoate 4-monooxygenase cytochrome P450, partial [Diaporthe sp. PMI_573]
RNVFLHPLSSHPGPKLWAASRIPWCWYQMRGLLNHRLAELHQVHGPVVRVAPDEVSYTSDTAWKTIYGQRSAEMAKDPVFSLSKPSGAQDLLTADRETHARQRRLLAHAFSEKALREQESILTMYASRLCEELHSHSRFGPVDMKDWYTFASFDLIGDLAFGQDFGCLAKGKATPFVAAISSGAQELTLNQMLKYYGLLPFARISRSLWTMKSISSAGRVVGAREENMRRAVEVVRGRVSRGPTADRKDFWHYVLQNLKDENELGHGSEMAKRGMSEPEMYANSFSITIAGSEGTATALAGATFLLLRHPGQYQRAVDEVRRAFHTEAEMTSRRISARVPFIEAILQEAMRLYPPVSITMPRRVPEGGAIIDGRFVAAGTTVGVNHLSCYRSSHNFEDAMDFWPERWLRVDGKDANSSDNFGAFQPFSFGPRSCLGKNLARAEMSLLL